MVLGGEEKGNVFIIILIAIFLFGALMYMFSRGASQGVGNVSKQQAKLAASEILSYAQLIENAVDRVRRNGCSETEISFENPVVAGYTNTTPSPVDKSCHIFENEGGKLSWNRLPLSVHEKNYTQDWNFNVLQNREDGNDTRDLAIFAPYLSIEVCNALNASLGVDTLYTDAGNANVLNKFKGNYGGGNNIKWPFTGFINLKTFCFESSSTATSVDPNTYHFVYTILLR